MSKKLIKIWGIIITTLTLVVLFLPLFFMKQIVFADLGRGAPDTIYIQNYNPFAPRIYWVNNNSPAGSASLTYAQLTRTGLWSFKGFNVVDLSTGKNYEKQNYQTVTIQNLSKEEIIKQAQKEDLTKSTKYNVSGTPQQQIDDRQKQIDEVARLKEVEKSLPDICKLNEYENIGTSLKPMAYSIQEIENAVKNTISAKDFASKLNDENGQKYRGSVEQDENKVVKYKIKITDPQYPKLKLVQMYFGDMIPNREFNPEDKLSKIYLVLQDCTRIEVLAKPDGTFDFESVKGQIQ
jgi:hypothetical protein